MEIIVVKKDVQSKKFLSAVDDTIKINLAEMCLECGIYTSAAVRMQQYIINKMNKIENKER